MGEQKPDPMDVPTVLEHLNRALVLQQRSVLQFTMGAGSMFGLEYQAVGSELCLFARAELEDTKLLVEKITALGGEPTTEVAPISFTANPDEAIDTLIDCEGETLEALQAAIEPTGREAASEAVEHRLEHMIMRKQEQVDYLLRARRRP